MKAFEVIDIRKQLGKTQALNRVTFSSEQGKILGVLGPNGAGKTTTIRILSTLLQPDSGVARVLNTDVKQSPQKVREMIGLAGQYAALDEFQTGYENIYMTGRLYGLSGAEAKKRTIELLQQLGLESVANRPVSTYSGGMRRRLDLGACLVCRPLILFLDEPTTGLDPKSRIDIWKIVQDLVREGTSVLLTTQYLEEADQLADSIVVLGQGTVIAEGTSRQLKASLGDDVIEFRLASESSRHAALTAVAPFAKRPPTYDESTLQVRVPVADDTQGLLDIANALRKNNLDIVTISSHQPSLDDVFLSLTGKLPSTDTRLINKTKKHGHGGRHGK